MKLGAYYPESVSKTIPGPHSQAMFQKFKKIKVIDINLSGQESGDPGA
jgi:hypothetical protein